MSRVADLNALVEGMRQLRNILGALRSLSGMRMQEALRALPGVRSYTDVIETAIDDALLLVREALPVPGSSKRRALVLCTAEHGFVGGFNERLLDAAYATLQPSDLLFVVGGRGAALALERPRRADWTHSLATRCAGAPQTAQSVSAELYGRISKGEIDRVEVIYARYGQAGGTSIERATVLPLEPTTAGAKQTRSPPLHNLSGAELYERLLAEHVLARLTGAIIETIAAENAARFAAMQSAHDNVSRRLENLQRDAQAARQEDITSEIADLLTAAKALRGSHGAAGRDTPGC